MKLGVSSLSILSSVNFWKNTLWGRSEEIQRYYYNNKYSLHCISCFFFCYNVRRDKKLTRDKIDKNDKLHSFPSPNFHPTEEKFLPYPTEISRAQWAIPQIKFGRAVTQVPECSSHNSFFEFSLQYPEKQVLNDCEM